MEEKLYDLDCIIEEPKLTAEYVLSRVDEYLIYKLYLGECKPGKLNKNPFRKDKNPSFGIFIGPIDHKLMWKDFSTEERGDIFKLVGKLFGLTYFNAIRRVAEDFKL